MLYMLYIYIYIHCIIISYIYAKYAICVLTLYYNIL